MAIVCGVVGNSKNRGFFAYFLGGLLLWPVVLTVAICAKRIEPVDVDAMTGAAFDLASLSNEQLERFNLLKQAGMASQEAYQEVVKMERNAT